MVAPMLAGSTDDESIFVILLLLRGLSVVLYLTNPLKVNWIMWKWRERNN